MTIIEIRISSMILTDINRRSFYVRATLFNHDVWLQWWPRSEPGHRLTFGFLRIKEA